MLKNAVASGRSPSHAAAEEEEESCVEGETAVPAVNVLGRVEQQPVLVAAKTAPAVGGDLLRRARLRPDVERDVGRGDREAVAARHRRLEERQLVLAQAEFRLCFAGGKLAGIERAGLDAFARLAATGKLSRDAVYFFADDYIGRGALSAISGAGLRAPDDIRVATWANKGLGPVYFRELSRMEMDPAEAGATVADSILEYLRTGRYPDGRAIGPRWLEGETLGKQCANRK